MFAPKSSKEKNIIMPFSDTLNIITNSNYALSK